MFDLWGFNVDSEWNWDYMKTYRNILNKTFWVKWSVGYIELVIGNLNLCPQIKLHNYEDKGLFNRT